MPSMLMRLVTIGLLGACSLLAQGPILFKIKLDKSIGTTTVSGRLLVFLSEKKPAGERLHSSFIPGEAWVAAMEVAAWKPGESIVLDPDRLAYPDGFSQAMTGEYWAMALLDTNHTYGYHGEDGGDWVSSIAALGKITPASAGTLGLTIDRHVPEKRPTSTENVKLVERKSALLTAFYGRPVWMRAGVVLPPSFEKEPDKQYPAAYKIHGFGGDHRGAWQSAPQLVRDMKSGELSDMVYVFLDASGPTGHHVFADSVNNGPWGRALTEEFIPYLERQYRLIADSHARFLTGHSSGGWSTLWLQITYPDFFGGTWSTSPDPVDFRSFTGVNATAGSRQNFYLTPEGKPLNVARMAGRDLASMKEFVQQEEVVGEVGGQMGSFEWVFSPKGPDGRPLRLFNRVTGELDLNVAKAWEKYDIRGVLERNWDTLGPKLDGKLHLTVGAIDNFHLEEPFKLLCDFLKSKGREVCEVVPGRDHIDLYKEYATYQRGLQRRIDDEMRVAFGR